MKKTHEEYVNELAEINPDVEVLGTYKNTNTPLMFRCKVCGHIWEVAACNLLRGTKCPKCNIRKRMLPEDEAIKRMEAGSPNTEVLGTYKGYGKTIACRCRKCGYEWNPYPRVLMKGCGCPRCAGNAPKDRPKNR